MPVAVKVLGPLIVEVEGVAVRLGPRQRALLIALALESGRVITSDRLIELLWGGAAPPSAVATLRSHVAHLRRRLEPGRSGSPFELLATASMGKGTGYALRLEPEQLDVHCFERLVEDARRALDDDRSELAVELVDQGLRLWRGPVLADVAHCYFALPEIARLEELRHEAIGIRPAALLAGGRWSEAAGQLRGLVMAAPYDEELRGMLAVALYSGQRVAEAAQACQDGLRALSGCGLDSPSLQQLQRDILRRFPDGEHGDRQLAHRAGTGVARGLSAPWRGLRLSG